MTFSTCHCWSKTPPGRGGWMRALHGWNLKRVMAKVTSTRLREFGTAQSMRGSQKMAIYQDSITWCRRKATQKKKIPGSLHQLCNTFGSLSAPSTRRIRTSQSQPHLPSTLLHQWPDQQSSSPNESMPDQPKSTAIVSALKRTELLVFISFLALSLP